MDESDERRGTYFDKSLCNFFVASVVLTDRAKTKFRWKLLSALLFVNVFIQIVAMSLVSYVYENDEKFFIGWKLDVSWMLCTFSWSISLIIAGSIALVGWLLPSEDGYERLRDSGRRR